GRRALERPGGRVVVGYFCGRYPAEDLKPLVAHGLVRLIVRKLAVVGFRCLVDKLSRAVVVLRLVLGALVGQDGASERHADGGHGGRRRRWRLLARWGRELHVWRAGGRRGGRQRRSPRGDGRWRADPLHGFRG